MNIPPHAKLYLHARELEDGQFEFAIEGKHRTVICVLHREDFFVLRSVLRSGVQDQSLGVRFYDPVQLELPPKMKGD